VSLPCMLDIPEEGRTFVRMNNDMARRCAELPNCTRGWIGENFSLVCQIWSSRIVLRASTSSLERSTSCSAERPG